MSIAPEFLTALFAMAAAAFFCRAGGFVLMRFVTVTPRLEAGLRAIPIGVMIGIVAPVAMSGRVPELLGLGAILGLMKLVGNDVVAALSGVAAVAVTRLVLA